MKGKARFLFEGPIRLRMKGLRRTKKYFRIIGIEIGIQIRYFLNTNQIQVAHVSICCI